MDGTDRETAKNVCMDRGYEDMLKQGVNSSMKADNSIVSKECRNLLYKT